MPIRALRANKGEWAELYVFLKLIGEGRLYAATSQMERRDDSYLDVLCVLREEVRGHVKEYSREGRRGYVEIMVDGALAVSLPAVDFVVNADAFFRYLSQAKGRSVSPSDDISRFAEQALIDTVKSPSSRSLAGFGGKTDIVMRLRDSETSLVSTMGFSIKSQFGSPATLFNASEKSSFLFRLRGADELFVTEFNSAYDQKGGRDWKRCVSMIKDGGIAVEYAGMRSETFEDNLCCIRDSMPQIMGWMYREAMVENYEEHSLAGVTSALERANPCGFRRGGIYEKAVKDFLFDSFSGMTASKEWDGKEQVNGGYIVVKPDGEVLCYHASDRERFRDYLLANTHIEYVSGKKFKWGTAYEKNGDWYLPINASIRFDSVKKSL